MQYLCTIIVLQNSKDSYMSLHPLGVFLGIFRGWRGVGRTGRAFIMFQSYLRTLMARLSPLPCWIHLICWSFLYWGSKANAIAGVLWGIFIVWQLIWAIKQTTVSRIITWWLEGWIWSMSCPGEGVELGISGMRYPGMGTGVITHCSWTRNYTGRKSTTGSNWWSTKSTTCFLNGWVWWTKLSLVVNGPGLGLYFIMSGGMNIVVAISWILWLEENFFLNSLPSLFIMRFFFWWRYIFC